MSPDFEQIFLPLNGESRFKYILFFTKIYSNANIFKNTYTQCLLSPRQSYKFFWHTTIHLRFKFLMTHSKQCCLTELERYSILASYNFKSSRVQTLITTLSWHNYILTNKKKPAYPPLMHFKPCNDRPTASKCQQYSFFKMNDLMGECQEISIPVIFSLTKLTHLGPGCNTELYFKIWFRLRHRVGMTRWHLNISYFQHSSRQKCTQNVRTFEFKYIRKIGNHSRKYFSIWLRGSDEVE